MGTIVRGILVATILVGVGIAVALGVSPGALRPPRALGAVEQSSDAPGLTGRGWAEVDTYLQENHLAVSRMPRHPRSESIFEDLAAICVKDGECTQEQAAALLAESLSATPVGAYALDKWLRFPSISATERAQFCERMCREHPDAPVSGPALRYLTSTLPSRDAQLRLCDAYAEQARTARLGIEALVLKATLYEPDNSIEAARCYLTAWQRRPEPNVWFAGTVRDLLSAHGDWVAANVLSTESTSQPFLGAAIQSTLDSLANPAVAAVWKSASDTAARMSLLVWADVPAPQRIVAGTLAAGEYLHKGEADQALAILQQVRLLQPGAELDPPERVRLGCAVYGLSASDVEKQSPQHVQAFDEVRNAFLAMAQANLDAVSPAQRAHYRLLIADRQFRGNQTQTALDTLGQARDTAGLSLAAKGAVVERLADCLVKARKDYAAAAKAYDALYGEYADGTGPIALRLQTGLYFYRSEDYDGALRCFRQVSQRPDSEETAALSSLMQGLCYLGKGERALALEQLTATAREHPSSASAPQALFLIGTNALSDRDYAQARSRFLQVVDAYPTSDYAARARESLEHLETLQ